MFFITLKIWYSFQFHFFLNEASIIALAQWEASCQVQLENNIDMVSTLLQLSSTELLKLKGPPTSNILTTYDISDKTLPLTSDLCD